jgi:hypothetical protein
MIVNITPNSGNAALAKSGDILKSRRKTYYEDLSKPLTKPITMLNKIRLIF